jgi:CheY-like chemotaxis protein
VEISVSDTGTGIPKGTLDHIFEPFFTTKGLGKGTGLGLAAVFGTINEHHGCITVYSEVDMGTVIKLYLPLAAEQTSSEISAECSPGCSGGILLVDDEKLICEMGRALLEEQGFTVYIAEDGCQALEVYKREHENIVLVIMDAIMPVMGGKEALHRLRATYPDVRVLISSGFHQNESNDSFIKLGAVGFIQKPYRTQELLKTINEALKSAV